MVLFVRTINLLANILLNIFIYSSVGSDLDVIELEEESNDRMRINILIYLYLVVYKGEFYVLLMLIKDIITRKFLGKLSIT
jgi:hypothetical protein